MKDIKIDDEFKLVIDNVIETLALGICGHFQGEDLKSVINLWKVFKYLDLFKGGGGYFLDSFGYVFENVMKSSDEKDLKNQIDELKDMIKDFKNSEQLIHGFIRERSFSPESGTKTNVTDVEKKLSSVGIKLDELWGTQSKTNK